MLTEIKGFPARTETPWQRLGHEAFARAVFAGDEDNSRRTADAGNHLEHGAHRRRLRDEGGAGLAARAEQLVFLFQPAIGANGHRVIWLRTIASRRGLSHGW